MGKVWTDRRDIKRFFCNTGRLLDCLLAARDKQRRTGWKTTKLTLTQFQLECFSFRLMPKYFHRKEMPRVSDYSLLIPDADVLMM